MRAATQNITYRLFQDTDLDGLLELWRDFSGWGAISEQQFRDWYLQTPYGPCIVALAVDGDDRMVGQMVFIPCRVESDGAEIKALRVVAPILHNDVRQNRLTNPNHPAFALYRCGMEEAIRQGCRLTYTFPAYGWQAFMKVFPRAGLPEWRIATFGCLALSLTSKDTLPPPKQPVLVANEIDRFTPGFDRLWADACLRFPIRRGIVRRHPWLQWKHGGHLAIGFREPGAGEWAGYAIVNRDSGLMLDALVRKRSDLEPVIACLSRAVHHLNPQRLPIPATELKVMRTPEIAAALRRSAFQPIDFTFTFGCNALDGSLVLPDPERWYLMPND